MSLARLLTDQRHRLTGLTQLLEEELQQLTQGQVDGEVLSRLAERKRTLLEELERRETLRRQVQSRLGYPEGMAGAAEAATEAGCQDEWEAYLAAAERTAHLNDLAGELIRMRTSHNQEMLDYLHQVAEKTLYDPSGRSGRQPGKLSTSA